MAWFRLEDGFYDHPKVTQAGNAATGLWVRCCTYSANKLLDGRVPMDIAHTLGDRRQIDRLTAAGLWLAQDEEYWVPDFLEYNPSAEQVRLDRKRAAEKKRRQRAAGSSSVDHGSDGRFMSRGVSPGDES